MSAGTFGVYTTLGVIPWTAAVGIAGYALGANWNTVANDFHGPTYVIAALAASPCSRPWSSTSAAAAAEPAPTRPGVTRPGRAQGSPGEHSRRQAGQLAPAGRGRLLRPARMTTRDPAPGQIRLRLAGSGRESRPGPGPGPARQAHAACRASGPRPPGGDHGHPLARSGPVTALPCPQAAWQGEVCADPPLSTPPVPGLRPGPACCRSSTATR